MTWLYFALISSVFITLREFTVKKTGKEMPVAFLSWGMNLVMFIIFLGVSLALGNWPEPDVVFFKSLALASVLDALAMILYLSAIKSGDLSTSIPMLCFIPVVQLFVTPILVHEQLTWTGVFGVCMVVSGSYLLNAKGLEDLLAPFRQIVHTPSSRMMLGVALLWGVSSSFHKIGVTRTSSLYWGMWELGCISLLLLPAVLGSRMSVSSFQEGIQRVGLPSLFSAVAVLSYYMAIALGPVAYVSSVRRLGVLFSMMAGIVFLKERVRMAGLFGGITMIAGAVVISLFG